MVRQFDLVAYGATGFTGRLVARYLAKHAPSDLKWAVGGRNRTKLEDLVAELKKEFPTCGEIGVAVGQGDSLAELARSTKAVISTAGPFLTCGEPLLAACINEGTDYADITGETLWVKRMMDKYGKKAKEKKVTVVNMSGFDSIPADLGTFFLVKHAREKYNVAVREVTGVFVGSGSVSGGTIASMVHLTEDKEARKTSSPFFLSPPGVIDRNVVGTKDKVNESSKIVYPAPDFTLPHYLPEVKLYSSPFVMSMINTRVVRKSAALYALEGKEFEASGPENKVARKNGMAPITSRESPNQTVSTTAYSPPGVPFSYQEFMGLNSIVASWVTFLVMAIIGLITRSATLTRFFHRFLPQPGSGPSQEKMRSSWFHYYLIGKTDEAAPRTLIARVMGGDAGYKETSKMLAEAGIMLATKKDKLPATIFGGGFLTPATAYGDALIKQLTDMKLAFEIVDARRFPEALKDRPDEYYERNPREIKQD